MVSGTTFWAIITVTVLAAVGFSWLEWRRTNRRHLAARLAATFLSVAALALLGLRPTWQHTATPSSGIQAILWTPTTSSARPAAPPGVDAQHHFALPDAVSQDPAAKPIPDAAFLRRHFPEIGTLHVLGDGLDPAELAALRGLHVVFTPPPPAARPPGLRFLHVPRVLTLGSPFTVDGRLGGLAAQASVVLKLDAPNGTADTTNAIDTHPDSATGEAGFSIYAAPFPATGRFLCHLRAPASPFLPALDLPVGVAVVPPDLPRLLILESAPRFDTGALRRWYETAGGTLVARSQIGQDRYRYAASAASPPPPFTVLDATLLSGFDLVLADSRAVGALPSAERNVLLAAVTNSGLGLLLVPDDNSPPADANPLLPWKLLPLTTDTPDGDRPARLQWPGQSVPTDLSIPTAPLEIILANNQRPLLGDRQGHTLAATTALGQGQLALTLVRDTTRWQRENDPAAFAAYWSFLFSRLARPAAEAGRWSLVEGDAGPVFVDHPLELLWSGPASPPPGPAIVSTAPAPDPVTLALAPDATEPGRWRGTFWPRRPGWHHVALVSGGPSLDFYVATTDGWSALIAERRQTATARFAAASSALTDPPLPPLTRQEFPPLWLAALFFLSTAYLWIERRLTT